ncbi:MAG: GNAT family N-acetyltransferase [Propionibacteriaceae bacterium]|nr:GNAT family N-acetyltransferase [Propionibacteriaceae bacterium]
MTSSQNSATEPRYTRNDELSRYEVSLGGELAGFLDYADTGSVVELPHTEINPGHEGRGLGSGLVRFALDDIAAAGGRSVAPHCPFVADWVQRHPDYAHLVEG